MPATRSNRMGLASILVGGVLGCATAQHQGQLDKAAAAMLSAMIVALYGVALKVMGRTTDAADHVHIRANLGAGAETMLIARSNWTQREVIPALEAQTGRSLRGRYFVLAGKALRGGRTLRDLGVREGSELEVRHKRHGGMGCAGSKAVDTRDVKLQEEKAAVNTSDVTPKVARPQSEYVDEVREKLAEVQARLGARSGAAGSGKAPASSTGAQMFEETTPMLVMPFPIFLAQGRIMKSTKKWREEALEKQWLVAYDESSGKVVIFVSHT